MKKIFSIAMLLLLVATMLYAGDTYDSVVYVRQTKTQVIYYGTVVCATANATDNHFTQFFQIDDCNTSNAYLWAKCSEVGTETIDAIVHYSANTDTSILSTLASGVILNDFGTTPVCDTINVATAVKDAYFNGARFMRINFDGVGSNGNTTVSWWAIFKKNDADVGAETQILSHKP